MRLLIRLRSLENSKYEMQYHYHLQGFIYNMLKDSKYSYLHDEEGYKFFCFSNIFPAYDLKQGDSRTLIISSPNEDFIEYLSVSLGHSYKEPVSIAIGSMKFEIYGIEKFHPQIPMKSSFTLITGTPIIIRIRKEKYEEFGDKLNTQYDEVYWRSDHPFILFIKQIESNLSKKYYEYAHLRGLNTKNEINHLPDSGTPFIQKFRFKKQISTRVYMKGGYHTVIGTLWEFVFNPSITHKQLIQFGLDSGLGERNSLGFGFMNMLIAR